MGALSGSNEITELIEKNDSESKVSGNTGKQHLKKNTIEDDINKLFEAIDIGTSLRGVGQTERHCRVASHKSAMKRPMRVGPSPVSGIGISESASLKQALRGLCISQASEMAAVKKRMSRPSASPGIPETGAIKKLYRTVVIEASEAGQPLDQGKRNVVEISLVPERSSSNISDKGLKSGHVSRDEVSEIKGQSSVLSVDAPIQSMEITKMRMEEDITPSRIQRLVKKKIVPKRTLVAKSCSQHNATKTNHDYHTSKVVHQTPDSVLEKGCGESDKASPASSSNSNHVVSSTALDSNTSKPNLVPFSNKIKSVVIRADEKSRLGEKADFSQSSKSSIGEYSSTTSYSEESHLSGSGSSSSRPHMSKDLRWEAISSTWKQQGTLGLRHFKLLRKIGGGDIGTVYLSELIGTSCLFAVKVMDNDFLACRKKMVRAQTEKEILEILDHPFLPTLYAHFATNKFSCLVMEFCPGGDLHVLRQKQLTRSFPEKASR